MRRIVTAEDYFQAALDLLVRDGPTSLKVGSLCEALGVTSGSFYGYFSGLDEFVSELITTRLTNQNQRLRELAGSDVGPEARLGQLRALARTVPHHAESAIRAWAQHHPEAGSLQRSLDQERTEALAQALEPVVASPEDAQRLGELGMAFLVGWQHLQPGASTGDFDRMFDEFETVVLQTRR